MPKYANILFLYDKFDVGPKDPARLGLYREKLSENGKADAVYAAQLLPARQLKSSPDFLTLAQQLVPQSKIVILNHKEIRNRYTNNESEGFTDSTNEHISVPTMASIIAMMVRHKPTDYQFDNPHNPLFIALHGCSLGYHSTGLMQSVAAKLQRALLQKYRIFTIITARTRPTYDTIIKTGGCCSCLCGDKQAQLLPWISIDRSTEDKIEKSYTDAITSRSEKSFGSKVVFCYVANSQGQLEQRAKYKPEADEDYDFSLEYGKQRVNAHLFNLCYKQSVSGEFRHFARRVSDARSFDEISTILREKQSKENFNAVLQNHLLREQNRARYQGMYPQERPYNARCFNDRFTRPAVVEVEELATPREVTAVDPADISTVFSSVAFSPHEN